MDSRYPLKDPPLRNPGQSLDEQIDREISDRFLGYYFGAAVFWVIRLHGMDCALLATARRPALYAIVASVASIGRLDSVLANSPAG